MPNIKSITLVTIDFAGAAMMPVARRPASRLTFVLALGSYGRGKVPSWFDAPVLFKAGNFEGEVTMKPPWLLLINLSSSCCRCTGSIGFTPTMRPLLSWIPFFWMAFRASYERLKTKYKIVRTVSLSLFKSLNFGRKKVQLEM